jgi:hypothetical protein
MRNLLVVLVLSWVPLASATVTFSNTAITEHSSFSTTSVIAFPSNNTLTDTLFASCFWGTTSAVTASIADSQSNKWVAADDGKVNNTSGGVYSAQSWMVTSAKSGANTVTVTFSESEYSVCVVGELNYTGAAFDKAYTGFNITASSMSVGPITTTHAGDVLFCWGGNASSNSIIAATGSWTVAKQVNGGNEFGFLMYEIVSSAGSYSCTGTISGGADGIAQVTSITAPSAPSHATATKTSWF